MLLVHGTWANASDWTERGRVWQAFHTRLLPEVELRPFRWSGENSESARYGAGGNLLHELVALEAARRPYYIVAHSHGGSVVWHALQAAHRRRRARWWREQGVDVPSVPDPGAAPDAHPRTLPHLRGWTTVGTPFLTPEAPAGWRLWIVFWGRIAAGIVALALLGHFAAWPLAYALAGTLGRAWPAFAWRGGFGQLAAAAVLAVPFVLLVLPTAAAFVLPGVEVTNVADEVRAADAGGAAAFHDRWRGVWVPEDEALLGLQAAGQYRGPLLPAPFPDRRGSPFTTHQLEGWMLAGLRLCAKYPLRLGRRWLDACVLRPRLAAGVQGMDRPGVSAARVSPVPHPSYGNADEQPDGSLPPALRAEVLTAVSARAPETLDAARALLGQVALTGRFALGGPRGGRPETAALTEGLVHTTYLRCDGVLDHVCGSARAALARGPACGLGDGGDGAVPADAPREDALRENG